MATFSRMIRALPLANEHVIDLNAAPFVPPWATVDKHQTGGFFTWDPKQVELYLSPNQREEENHDSVLGFGLHCEIAEMPIFNANLLDYLLAHKDIIPEEWKRDEQGRIRYICFWGTIYRHNYRGRSYPYVRCLYWSTNKWSSVAYWLGHEVPNFMPAAIRINAPRQRF